MKTKYLEVLNMRKLNEFSLSRLIGVNLILIFLFLLILPNDSYSNYKEQDKDKNKNQNQQIQKVTDDPVTTLMNINNLTLFVNSSGFHAPNYGLSWSSAFPKGTAGGIFQEGIVWGGLVNDGQSPTLRVGGNTYFSGTQAIERIYRVRPDYETADLTDDAANFFYFQNYPLDASAVSSGDIQTIRDQYAKDWMEWPADKGAPFDDVDGNGIYDPSVDIPGIPGASQTIWLLYNDAVAPQAYGSPPIGVEVAQTIWAYAVSNPLSNVIFKKVNLVYTGTGNTPANATINDMYMVQWADPDVGQYTDDFAGCDSNLNLGYAYSSSTNDAVYSGLGLAPPALGYDFLQGVSEFTGNPNDSAIINLQWRKGYKYVHPKPLTVFTYFAAGGAWSDPSGQNPDGTPQWYNLMRGFLPRPQYPASQPFPASVGGTAQGYGTYLLSGDPVAGTGLLDGSEEGPGDRRIVNVTGPFNMALGDTAEIVVALIGGIGSSNTSSVAVLKFNDIYAQYAYDNLFQLPIFPSPNVSLSNLDNKIVLNWGSNLNEINRIENAAPQGYSFQGYNVYQFPNASFNLSEAVRIATYDLVDEVTVILDDQFDQASGEILQLPVQLGRNSGIKRFIEISSDAVRNQPLRNGQEYYFGVTAYGYNPDTLGVLPFKALESSPTRFTAIPQSPKPGVRLTSTAGDTVQVTHTGPSDGEVIPIVVDPSLVTGDQYRVTFDVVDEETVWNLHNVTTNQPVLTNQTNQEGDDNYLIIDGLQVKVQGPPPGVKTGDPGSDNVGWDIPQGTRRFTFASADGFGWEGFHGAIGWGSPHGVFGGGSEPIPASELKNVLLILGSVPDTTSFENPGIDPDNPPADENFSFAYRYGRGFTNPPARPEFAPYIVNTAATGGYSFQDFKKSVPLSAWDVEDPNNPRRLAVGFLENNGANALLDGRYFPGDFNLYDNVATDGPREWLFIFDADYSETPDPAYMNDVIVDPVPVMFWLTVNRRGPVPFSPGGSGEDQFAIFPNKINTPDDVFEFTAPDVTQNSELAKVDVEKINVFPNPYYGTHYRETTREGKYVTFSHLPARATIRVFDLAGVLVRTIEKDSPDQYTRWNLQNNNNYPVASGIYVVYIDMPELGTTKILKLAIVQEEQILRVY
jgi:hypothetical protein